VSAEVERLWRFLLGEASDEERDAVEEEFFADTHRLAMVESAEDELIDAYVCGELSTERRQRFAERFLATASQRARVALAQALADRATPATATQPRTLSARPRRRR
jgi:anti-sigma factor RsiW